MALFSGLKSLRPELKPERDWLERGAKRLRSHQNPAFPPLAWPVQLARRRLDMKAQTKAAPPAR